MIKQHAKLKPKHAITLNDNTTELISAHRQKIAIQIAIGKLEKKLEQNEHYIEELIEANQYPNESLVNAHAQMDKHEIHANIFHENLKLL